jgi:L-lactate dehydrogenase complex protein LldG
MAPVILLEPDSTGKRRHFAATLLGPKGVFSHPTIEELKQQLRELRSYSVGHLDSLVDQLTSRLTAIPEVEFSFAADAAEAVETIKGISGNAPIAISKSALATNELMPALVASGLHVIETYYEQFDSFENRFSKPWELPAVEYESVLEAFDRRTDLGALRDSSVRKQGSKNFTGLLGVNAISANDGAVVLVQHAHNISEIFIQADKLILIASVDKIVQDLDAAVFQARCMAVFGWEALPLSLHGRTGDEKNVNLLPFEVSPDQTSRRIHLILLDNGRRQLLHGRYENLLACIGCRACTRSCPAFPFLVGGIPSNPKEYIHSFVTGRNPSLELCLQCRSCRADCPLDIDLPGMILDARIGKMAGKRRQLADRFLANPEIMMRWGRLMPVLANVTTNNGLVRWLGEKALGIGKERPLPRFQGKTFARWFRSSAGDNTGES